MTTDEGNAFIAKFIGLKLKSDGKTYELNDKFAQILKCKTTQFVKFNENLELLMAVVEHLSTIKDLWVSVQFDANSVYVNLFYKAQFIEGDWRFARFCCERTKPANKFKQALFEVVSGFCGWYYNHPECQTEIEYKIDHIIGGSKENTENIIYMKPLEVVCPHCDKIYRKEDVRKKDEDSDN